MQTFEILLFALTALSAGVSAAVIPAMKFTTRDVSTNLQYQELRANQSLAFGWQFSGAAINSNELDATCNILTDGKCDKWIEQGLDLGSLQGPICNSTHTPINATTALPSVVSAFSKAFSVALLNSFDMSNKSTYSYMCQNLRYKQLDSFYLDSLTITNATCVASNNDLNPEPFSSLGEQNTTLAVNAYQNAHSVLYGYQYASQATGSSQLNQYCAHAPEYRGRWNALQLNATLVESTICSFKEPISAEDGAKALCEWSSKAFVIALKNVSNVQNWRGWLCSQLKVDSMNAVGLDGTLVKKSVCRDA